MTRQSSQKIARGVSSLLRYGGRVSFRPRFEPVRLSEFYQFRTGFRPLYVEEYLREIAAIPAEVPALNGGYFQVTGHMKRIGDHVSQDTMFDGAAFFGHYLPALLEAQWDWREGVLQHRDGEANIFCVKIGEKVYAVHVYRFDDLLGNWTSWSVQPFPIETFYCDAGYRIFSATTPLALAA